MMYKKETRELNPGSLADTALCDMLESVCNIACPHDIISGCVPPRIVVMNGAEVLVAFIHIIEKIHHFLE